LELTGAVGIIAGILTSISLLPQLVKIIRQKKAEELSIGMFITLLAGLALWVFYGVLRNDMPLIVTNGFSVLLNIWILFLTFRYQDRK